MQTLFKAIYSRFKADTDLYKNVSDMYNAVAPADAKFPYIVFSLVSDVQDFDSHNVLEDVMFQFNIFSKKKSPKEVSDIFEYLKGNTITGTGYDFYELLVDNYNTLILKREAATLAQVDEVWQYNITYRCRLSYTGETAVEKFYGNLYALLSV